jgi:hypothetical protein
MKPRFQVLGLACFALSVAAFSGCGSTTVGGGGSGGETGSSSSSSGSASSSSGSASSSSGTASSSSGTASSSSGTASSSSGTASSSSSTGSSSSGSTACTTTSDTMLPGVHIEIDGSACTFSLSDPVAQVSIPYQIVVDQDVTGVTPRPQDAGQCDKPGASGLITFAKVAGNNQQYCLCDVGLCAPQMNPAVTIKAGTYPATFTWDKHTWFGPSDFNNPEGPLFTAGDYTLTISAIGLQTTSSGDVGWTITATMPVHLVP